MGKVKLGNMPKATGSGPNKMPQFQVPQGMNGGMKSKMQGPSRTAPVVKVKGK